MVLPAAHIAGPSTAMGGGFVNCFASVDTEASLVSLHGAGLALAGGDVWGKVRSSPDALRSGAPGGLLVWQGSKGNAKGKQICGLTFSRVQAGRCYAFHGSGEPSSGQANSGYVGWSDDGLSWHEISTGNSPANFQHGNPRGVGQTIISRAVAGGTKDQLIIAGADGVYVTQDATAGTSNAGCNKVALGDLSGAFSGLVCVGLDRDPNNADIIYVATRATVGASALSTGVYKLQINSSGALVGSATLLFKMTAQEVCAVAETGGTAVYAVGLGGVTRYKNGAVSNWNGGMPNGSYTAIDGFNLSGSTVLAVGNMGNAGQQLFWVRFTDTITTAPSWTALDVGSRISTYPVYGQPTGDNYWAWQPGGKKGSFALGVGGQFMASQIIVIPRGLSSADIYVAGRSLMYALIDVGNASSKWQVSSKGTNASVANVVAASPIGGQRFAHGDLDFLVTTTEDGYSVNQPRIHQPQNKYFYAINYDEKGGLYVGSSDGPSTGVKTHGLISYHPSPHDHNYSNTDSATAAQTGKWLNYVSPGVGTLRVTGVFGCWPTSSQRVLICVVLNDKAYRRVDAVSGTDSNGKPASFNLGNWSPIPNLCVGTNTSPIDFARGSGSTIYCLDPGRGLCRSDDNGVSFSVIDNAFTGGACAMDNDPAQPDRIALIKGAGAWLIENAKTSPGTKTQIQTTTQLPNASAICFDRDSSMRTSGKSRLYAFSNAPSGGNGTLKYSDDAGGSWTNTGGPLLASTCHTVTDMAANSGYLAMVSTFGGVMIAVPSSSAPTDTTAPTPNPITGVSGTANGPNSVTFNCDTAQDAGSGVRGYQYAVSPNGTSGWVNVGAESPTSQVLVTDTAHLIAGTTYFPGCIVTDNNGNAQATRGVGSSFTLPTAPTLTPTMLLNSVTLLDPTDNPTTATADISGSTSFDTGQIFWGDGAIDTIDPTMLTSATFPTHTYASAGTYSVAVTGTNVVGTSAPVSLQFVLGLAADDTGAPLALQYILSGLTTQDDFWPQYNATLDTINAAVASILTTQAAQAAAILALQTGGSNPTSTAWATPLVSSGTSGGTGGPFTIDLPTGLSTGKAYAFVQSKAPSTDLPAISGTTGAWTALNPAAVSNTNGNDTTFCYEHTVASGDSGQTITIANGASGAVLKCGFVIILPEASGRDTFTGTGTSTGFLSVANSGATGSGTHNLPATTTAGTNRLVLCVVGGRFAGTSARHGYAPNSQLVEANTTGGDNGTTATNNMFIVCWYILQPTAGLVPTGQAISDANAFSIGTTVSLVHS